MATPSRSGAWSLACRTPHLARPFPRLRHPKKLAPAVQVLTAAYEGKGLDYDYLCQPNPNVVPLTADGYSEIKAQNQSRRLASFIRRVVVHLGATVVNATAMEQFAAAEECFGVAVKPRAPGGAPGG